MKVGDRIPALIPMALESAKEIRAYPATVVYVQPEERFYTAEFEIGGWKFRESFPLKNDF